MATAEVSTYNKYLGNGVTTEFSIGFPYLKREYVKVYVKRKDYEQESISSSDFSFVNDSTIKFPANGSTQSILSDGDVLTVQRETPLQSDFIFSNQKRLFPDDVMDADDLSFQQIQELARDIKRSVKVTATGDQTPDELLAEVYSKLDSATEVAGDAINAANQAQTAADNATAAVESAEQTLVETQTYVNAAKVEIYNTKETALEEVDNKVTSAKADVNTAVDEATTDISNIVSNAEGSITNIAVTEANKAIANAAQEATDMAKANVNSYVDGTVKPSLQTYVDQAQEDANSAATSMEQAALSATAASNYASNARADADNAAESAGLAANSAATASASETNAKTSETNAEIWAEGTDAEVQALGGTKSAKGWAEASENLNYTNITNCITEIPQDIKLELNNGALALKAGSKVYIPNGFEMGVRTYYAWTSEDGETYYTVSKTPIIREPLLSHDKMVVTSATISAVGDGNITIIDERNEIDNSEQL